MRGFAFGVLLASLLVAGGCSFPKVPKVQQPTATVTGARVTEWTSEGASVEVLVEVVNPNDFPMPVILETYRLVVDGEAFVFSGRPGASMPPNDSQVFTLTGAVPTNGQNMRGAGYRIAGHFLYEKPGEVRRVLVDSGVPEPRIHFSSEGVLD